MKQFLEYLQSFTVIGLVLFGIGGVSYHMFRDDGWVEKFAGNIWDVSFQFPLIALTLIIAAVYFGRRWNEMRIVKGRTSKVPDVFIYLLMGAGAVFLGRYFIYGTL